MVPVQEVKQSVSMEVPVSTILVPSHVNVLKDSLELDVRSTSMSVHLRRMESPFV